ncbi:MAG TPA: histidine--tRNA ligase [Candidatus Aminicenantes bacterium]|nr:histidine--tRNA ligase [Candidatus Aminicenantes bacterium]
MTAIKPERPGAKAEPAPPQAIKGTHDILPGEVEKWQALERLARETFELYRFRELRAPVFEPTELFEKGTGATSDVVTKEMYTFTDRGGRSLTLRPEYTPSVVRAIIEHRLDLEGAPMRYYFMGPMFRYDKPQKGRYRQFHQIDIEVFGEKDAAVDAEIVDMAHALLGKLGVTGTETLVNSVGCRACRPPYSAALREAAGKRLADLCPDCRRKAEANPLRIFDCKIEACREIAAAFPSIQDFICRECREHFGELLASLDVLGIPYRVEPRLVRGLDYYTKTTFEIVSPALGAQNSLLGGGRYDDMMKDFGGPDICGTGFAMGIERVLSVADLRAPARRLLYVAHLGRAGREAGLALARFFRGSGVECLMEFKDRGMKAHFGRANKLGADWVLIVGEDEMAKGRFGLKAMATGRQADGTREELLAVIRES